jgi:hypothetical protein
MEIVKLCGALTAFALAETGAALADPEYRTLKQLSAARRANSQQLRSGSKRDQSERQPY